MSPLNLSFERTEEEIVESDNTYAAEKDFMRGNIIIEANNLNHSLSLTKEMDRIEHSSPSPSLASVSAASDSDHESFEDDAVRNSSPEGSHNKTIDMKSLTSGQISIEVVKLEREQNKTILGETKLSKRLKVGTTESHNDAENVHFVRNFIKGKIRLDLYKELIVSLYHVYSAMENELDKHASYSSNGDQRKKRISSLLGAVHRPIQLSRTQSLRDDLSFFYGSRWEEEDTVKNMSEATAEYVERIKYVSENNPLLLLGHSYTRYLGDLSGGRILQRVARKALGLPKSGEGTKFYEFENMPEGAKAFKKWYRGTLDEMSLNEKELRQVVGEANVTFVLNMRIFEELDVRSGEICDAVVRPLSDALDYYDRSVAGIKTQEIKRSRSCPFAVIGNGNIAGIKTQQIKRSTSCPFPVMGIGNPHVETITKVQNNSPANQRCPWPFIILHDPLTGFLDYQSWVFILVAYYAYVIFSA